jgi:flagella basal body P-ring formation protein FlgA
MSRSQSLWIVMSGTLWLVWLWPAGTAAAGESSPDDLLQIHLPRKVTVQDPLLTLGQVSVVRGGGALAAVATTIPLGRFSAPGQTIVLDRPTILSRLATQGIPGDKVLLTGAQAVMVRRHQQIINGDEFISLARSFLQQNPPGSSFSDGVAAVKPKDMVLPGQSDNVQLTPRFLANGSRGFVTVQIAVVVDGQELGSREIPLRLRYRCHKAVTSQEIAEGAKLTPDNVKVEEEISDRPEAVGWQPPYGSVTRRTLPMGTEIRPDMIDAVRPSPVVRRNETVVIRIQRPGFVVTALGQSLQEARAGEYVKVRNTDSHRIIVCKVNADGTVEPVL